MKTGCLQCGGVFEAVRSDAKFCSDACRKAYDRTPENERYLNPPIICDIPMEHGQLYTDGSEIKLEKGILRVRKRYEDPVMKAKEREELKAEVEQRGENRVVKQAPKRRGS